ncbi:fumarylacetoacetate (FAA) hydrolase [Streptomyces albus]|uniref:Fumarylacetoacetate (FAA) hydrolase n=1 Tax=Streptomyces albus (strain ATCC 21838 / DSM 41398 / FERM P-419 / JCM 4703 / NBRC 107858) TaxID=1081613 RepID=A0A0B5F538_STRA4|nr:fumarylacetoacetate (FAA) hydrolase [Streptomyces albus]AOU79785.1 fumarylacetoacetate (FAA) hydrolase [Streptomyces albus]AYN35510.1 FAA hydrolase family protein [Streptomyces albus]
MRFVRWKNGDEVERYASADGARWTRLDGLPAGARLVDLAVPEGRARLVEPRLAEASGAELDLTRAATVMDGGDIWGAGLNFLGHSQDLGADQPTSAPGSYLRPGSCLIDNAGTIELPRQSARVTAEAELGLVIGFPCKNVSRDGWRDVVAGVTAVLDLTAEDAIRENPRHIPWSKGFDTFCSIGPQLVTLDEFDDERLRSLTVSTVRNGEVVAAAPVSGMRYDLGRLVEHFTAGRTLAPGTVICTGTPGAAVINPGDRVEAVVDGVGRLGHPVT